MIESEKARLRLNIITRSKLFIRPTILVILVVIIAISLGLGFGLGNRRASSNSTTTGIRNSTVTNPPLRRNIVNDSSLAAIITSEGTKYVFYQDTNGTIRQTMRTSSQEATWTSTIDSEVASDARNFTPIATLFREHVSPELPFAVSQVSVDLHSGIAIVTDSSQADFHDNLDVFVLHHS